MQKSIQKSDDSVKTGLEIADHSKTEKEGTSPSQKNDSERDEDDLVHQSNVKSPKKKEEEDIDDLAHQKRTTVKVNPAEEQDIDDLMHKGNDYKKDQ